MDTKILTVDVGIKNLAICVLQNNKIISWKVINVGYGNDICKSIIKEFDECHETFKDSIVLIERQMTRKMTNIQCYIEMYFRVKTFTDVIIYNPLYKLSGTGMEHSGGGKKKYGARKQAAIELSREWLDKNPQEEWVGNLWKATKKKDDLSDTLCMAISYLKNPVKDHTNIMKTVNPRKPTIKQESSGNYSKSNIKFLLSKSPKIPITKKLGTAITKYWKSLEICIKELEVRNYSI
jgi:hypothetical protein